MVQGTSIHRPTALPASTSRINTARTRTTPVFSVISKPSPDSVASVKKSPASAVPATLVTTPQSQVPSTSLDSRQLFSGLPSSLVTAPAGAAFVPTFRTATVTDGVNVWGLNHNY